MKMILCRAWVLAVAGVSVLLGPAAPAHAQSPDYTDGCGSVEVRVNGFADDLITVQRDQVTVTSVRLGDDGEGQVVVGVVQGSRITIDSRGSTEHIYQPPDGCTLPSIDVGSFPQDGCHGNTFVFADNQESTPVAGLVRNGDGLTAPVTFPPGLSLTAIGQPLDTYDLQVQLGTELVHWFRHTLAEPGDDCAEPQRAFAEFSDDCDSVTINVANLEPVDRNQIYIVQRNQDADPVAVGITENFIGLGVHTLAAQPGDVFQVVLIDRPIGGPVLTLPAADIPADDGTGGTPADAVSAVQDGTHTFQPPASCGTGGAGGAGGSGSEEGGPLPITGVPAGVVAVVGAAFVLGGIVLVVTVGRRRRLRFMSTDH